MHFPVSATLHRVCSAIINVFLEETDAIDKETPTYPSATFLADVGGAAGLIFGLNIMETDFLNKKNSQNNKQFKSFK